MRQVVVKLVRDTMELGQTRPRHAGEVVMFAATSARAQSIERALVIADIVGERVERTVVGEGLVAARGRVEDVVLGDEVGRAGVETAGEEGAEDEVGEGPPAEQLVDAEAECELDSKVERDPGRWPLGADEAGSQGVEEDLECAEAVSAAASRPTHQKNVLPKTLLRQRSSKRVGRSVSMPSSPRCLWCCGVSLATAADPRTSMW